MEKEKFLKLVEKLEGLDYCFFSGFVMFLVTNGKRKFNDIDILINEKDIYKLAKRLGAKVKERIIEKGKKMKDLCIEANFAGFEIEIITNTKEQTKERRHVSLILNNKIKINYFGEEIFIEPLEEMLARKAFLHRDKDLLDLEILKHKSINVSLLNQFAENWGKKEEIISLIKKIGFDLK